MFTWNEMSHAGRPKAAGQQQVFAAEDGRQCLLPDLPAIIGKAGSRDAGAQGLGQSVGGAVIFHSTQQVGADALLP